ncbi:MAG: hypothetical protein DUD26_06710 [Eubacteriaceae bacterium]|uniref:Uncharacterized protein n=1 Tax=Candidatus Pseudoramibacter fermentans TaxID=2594427 RepID=A0A6L5GPL4_9FIRM|nr:hypothetical protein [Candidatus Pseudoramibacter fermentans]RRF92456.1 MAG: hypothetical protein DUD26_06710 [Eubacteriaceae bacterium]
MKFLMQHTQVDFDIWALLTFIVLVCAIVILIVRKLKMKEIKDDLQDQIDDQDQRRVHTTQDG